MLTPWRRWSVKLEHLLDSLQLAMGLKAVMCSRLHNRLRLSTPMHWMSIWTTINNRLRWKVGILRRIFSAGGCASSHSYIASMVYLVGQ